VHLILKLYELFSGILMSLAADPILFKNNPTNVGLRISPFPPGREVAPQRQRPDLVKPLEGRSIWTWRSAQGDRGEPDLPRCLLDARPTPENQSRRFSWV